MTKEAEEMIQPGQIPWENAVAAAEEGTQAGVEKAEKGQAPEITPREEAMASVGALSEKIPAWQKAALLRFMNWQDDRMVSESEFAAALESLQNRRIGGGRK